MTTIYLSDNVMQAVGGEGGKRAVVTRCASSEEIGGCMFGGAVSDKETFCRIVSKLFADGGFSRSKVRLVLNTTQLMTKELKAPAKDEGGTIDYIANELADVDRTKAPVYGYMLLNADRKTRINRLLAAAADADYIAGFVSLFAQCGVTLASVEPALCSAIRVLDGAAYRNRTCVVQIMEAGGFTSLLFVDGAYAYSTYTRLVSAHGTAELGSEVARSVSSLSQFAKAQQIDHPLTDVLFAGFGEEDRVYAAEAIGRMGGGIRTDVLPDGGRASVRCRNVSFSDCVFAAGGMLSAPKTINFLYRMSHSVTARKKTGRLARTLIGLAALLAVMIALTVAARMIRDRKQAELDSLNAYIASDEVNQKLDTYNALYNAQMDAQKKADAADTLQGTADSYPIPNSTVNDVLQSCASGLVTVEILQYDSSTGELNLNTKADNVDSIHSFIEKLGQQDIFQVENYSGYTYVEDQAVWSVSVVVVLSAGAGRKG